MVFRPEALIAQRLLRASESDVVSLNKRKILRLIWRNPNFSRSEITAHTDLTQQSIYRIVDQLAECGIISLGVPTLGLGKGQPSPMLRLDGSIIYCCGMSVNTDVIDICPFTLPALSWLKAASLCESVQWLTRLISFASNRPSSKKRFNLSQEALFGVGFAIAWSPAGGTRFSASLQLHELSLVELGPMLKDVFDKPVWTLNGGKAGTIAESLFGWAGTSNTSHILASTMDLAAA